MLFSNAEIAERMGELLCATWADKAALLQLCGVFVGKLLRLLRLCETAATALIKFVQKCPSLGNKHDFLVRQFGSYVQSLPGRKAGPTELVALRSVLVAQASKMASLIEMMHALGCDEVRDGETVELFYRLLDAEETSEKKVAALRSCHFSTPPLDAPDECVDAPLFESYAETAAAAAGTMGVGGLVGEAHEATAIPLEAGCGFYAWFGEAGEATMRAYLAEASPRSLATLLGDGDGDDGDGKAFRQRCSVVIRAWVPAECKPEEVGYLLTLVGWFPELRQRCANLVFAVGDEANVRQLMVGVRPDLDQLPTKWWGCVHWPSCKASELARLISAGVVVPLDQVLFAERDWPTQQLLLEAHRDDLGGLVDFAADAEGPMHDYLVRVFELLPASSTLLSQMGDGARHVATRRNTCRPPPASQGVPPVRCPRTPMASAQVWSTMRSWRLVGTR